MNKDALLATLIGFIIGLVITGILLAGPTIAKGFPNIKWPTFTFSLPKGGTQGGNKPTPTPIAFFLTIDSPLTDSIEEKTDVLVSGKTIPEATVVIAGSVDEIVVTADDKGTYAGKVKLMEGKNEVVVTSYDKEEEKSQTVTVFYTPEKL